jgi:hypothetical protein
MPAKLEQGKQIKRLVKIHGIEGFVEVSFSHEGIAMRVPKTRKSLTCMWTDIIGAMYTPNDVPSFLMGEPLKFLLHEAEKVVKKREKKAKETK